MDDTDRQLLALFRTNNLELFDRVLGRVRSFEGVANTKTGILQSHHKL